MTPGVPPRRARTRTSGDPVPPLPARATYPLPGARADPTRRLTSAFLRLGQELERTARTVDALIAQVEAGIGDDVDASDKVPAAVPAGTGSAPGASAGMGDAAGASAGRGSTAGASGGTGSAAVASAGMGGAASASAGTGNAGLRPDAQG